MIGQKKTNPDDENKSLNYVEYTRIHLCDVCKILGEIKQ